MGGYHDRELLDFPDDGEFETMEDEYQVIGDETDDDEPRELDFTHPEFFL